MKAHQKLQDLRIVLVDDDDSIRASLDFYFRKKKVPGKFFADAEHALEYLGRHGADLVITDYRLPGINGLELIKELNRVQPDVAKILITAYGSFDIAVEAIKLGVHDFIQKPFNTKTIEEAIQGVFDKMKQGANGVFLNGHRVGSSVAAPWTEDLQLTLGKITHKLNNSLFSIIGNAELGLHSAGEQAGVSEKLHHIIDEVQQMGALNDSLMSLCLEPPRIVEKVDLEEIILGCIGRFHAQAHQCGINIRFDADGNEDFDSILSNKDDIRDVIENLLVNSIQALRATSRPNKVIEITLGGPKTARVVSIADTGDGIDPGVLPKIFEKGFTTKADGHGLGLHIVKGLVEELGGVLDIRSQPGEGTRVEITLPVDRSREMAATAQGHKGNSVREERRRDG